MKKNTFKRIAAAFAACTLMASAAPMVIAPASFAAAKVLVDSDFESNMSGWGIYKESGGVATLSVTDGKLAIDIKDQGKKNYAVQPNYDIIPLYKNGVYRFSFQVSSTVPCFIEAMIQMNGGDYRAYTWKGVHATEEVTIVDYTFTMEDDTDIMTKMCFNMGVQEKEDGGSVGPHVVYLDNVLLELIDDSAVDYNADKPYETSIITNQIGYKPDAKKTAVFRNTSGGEFSVVNAETREVVYTGEMVGPKTNTSADEKNYTGDFSSVKAEGKYFIKSAGLDDSYTFTIGEDVYSNLLDDSVKMLYLQRCGTAVEGGKHSHPACHTSIATIYQTNTQIDVTGGWHDAGDYGRYIVAAAKAVADLMYAYKAAPELYSDSIGIPESGNGTPDILDEVKYELDWMMKMQDASDGGVYHKVSCASFPGYVMPEDEKDPLIVMPKSTPATADFAASMALAYEIYKGIDQAYAEKCLAAGKKAYEWAKANPSVTYKNPADVVTGEYGDARPADELYWAAAQLYRATGESSYLDGVAVKTGLDWSTVGDYGNIAILTMDGIDKNSTAYQKAYKAVVNQADDFKGISSFAPYGSAITKYEWGSNMTIANAGIILALASELTGDASYMDAANAQLNYLLGTNPNGASFVTGYGTVSPENPHHRPSMAAGEAMKGMLVGGVNQNLEDSAAKAYCVDNPPAKCWIDNGESYSTNEITIYWNSPLTYLLSLTDAEAADLPVIDPTEPVVDPTTEPTEEPTAAPTEEETAPGTAAGLPEVTLLGDANCDGKVSIADSTAILQSMANADKYGLSIQGEANGDCYEPGSGISGLDALAIQRLDAKLINALPEYSANN